MSFEEINRIGPREVRALRCIQKVVASINRVIFSALSLLFLSSALVTFLPEVY